MSRNFGIPPRGPIPRKPEFFSQWSKDVLALALLAIFMGSVLAVGFIEFPDGLADLRAVDMQLISNHR